MKCLCQHIATRLRDTIGRMGMQWRLFSKLEIRTIEWEIAVYLIRRYIMKSLSTTFFVRQEQVICPQDIRLEEYTWIGDTIVDMTLCCEMDTISNLMIMIDGTNKCNISDISLYKRVITCRLDNRINIVEMSCIGQ